MSLIAEVEQARQARDFKKVETLFARWLKMPLNHPERARALMLRAQIRLQVGRTENALEDLREALSLDPALAQDPHALEIEADSIFQQFELAAIGFTDKASLHMAKERYEQIVKNYPHYENMGWVLYQLGRIALIQGNANVAQQQLTAALFKPSPLKTLTSYCFERLAFLAFYEQRDYAQAQTLIQKAIDTYPAQEAPTWMLQAYLFLARIQQTHNPDAALSTMKSVRTLANTIQNLPKTLHAEVLFTLAEVLSQRPNAEREVIENLQAFLQISKSPIGVDVTYGRVYEMLGNAFYSLQRYEQALNAYQMALHYNPYHPWEEAIKYRISQLYYLLQNYQKTIQTIEQMLSGELLEVDYRLYEILGNAHFALGDYSKARHLYEKVFAVAPNGVDLSSVKSYYEAALKKEK